MTIWIQEDSVDEMRRHDSWALLIARSSERLNR
jgi:hypothetical protein